MKKQDKIQDSPEFQYYKADFENFKKGMEDDKEYADLKMPDGWEQDFAKTIDDNLDGNERIRKNKIIKRIVGVAAAVVLFVTVGNLTAEQVSGENLLEMFMNILHFDGNQQMLYGNENEIEIVYENGEEDILFSGNTLLEVNEQIRQEIKRPMLYLNYVPEGFEIIDARYSYVFRTINIELMKDNEYIFIYEYQLIDENAVGVTSEENKIESVINKQLNKQIAIHENMQDDFLTFCVENKESVITVNTSVDLEECKKMAESIDYK